MRDLGKRKRKQKKKNKGKVHEAERQRKENDEKVSEGNAHSTISQILRSFLSPGPFCKVKKPHKGTVEWLNIQKIFLREEFTDRIRGERKQFPQDHPGPVRL